MRPTIAFAVASVIGMTIPAAEGQRGGSRISDVQVLQSPGGPPVVRDPAARTRPQPPTGTAVVAGVVISGDGGRPVRRATVRLAALSAGPALATQADEQGRFAFTNVPAGRFTLTATKPGYLDSVFGQRRPGSGRPGTPISLEDNQRLDRLSLPLARGGVLAGTVTDDAGEPAFGTTLRAYRFAWDSGERSARSVAEVQADDRGQYRLGGLPPGDYVITATPPGVAGPGPSMASFDSVFRVEGPPGALGRFPPVPAPPVRAGDDTSGVDTYAPVFFPGALNGQDATVITLDIGEERGGLDVQMPFVSTGRIAGTVMQQGQPAGGVQVRLERVDATLSTHNQMTLTNPDGSFVLGNLPPGRYRLAARRGPERVVQVDQANGQTRVTMEFMSGAPSSEGATAPTGNNGPAMPLADRQVAWAGAEVSISSSETQHVYLSLERGLSVSGRVTFDGSGQAPSSLDSITVALTASGAGSRAGGAGPFARVGPDGRFTITDVLPGRYRPVVLAGAWRAKRFELQGQDALDTLLEVQPGRDVPEATVTLTTQMASITGVLSDAAGQPAAGYTIIVFADDQAYWTPRSRRIAATRPATDGRFLLGDLPPGRYRLVAVEDIDEGQWFDPALLGHLSPSAIGVELGDGATLTQDIRLAR